jgi:hypothetical protein
MFRMLSDNRKKQNQILLIVRNFVPSEKFLLSTPIDDLQQSEIVRNYKNCWIPKGSGRTQLSDFDQKLSILCQIHKKNVQDELLLK